MQVSACALCERIRECSPKEIEGTDYDICSECWSELDRKLHGKGRTKCDVVIVSHPAPPGVRREPDEKPLPGMPPKIWLS